MSGKYNLVVEQNTTFPFQFVVKNDSTPWDLTGYSVTMTVRPFVGSSTTTFLATNSNGFITIDGTNGRITLSINAATTTAFTPGRYVYDILLTSGGGVKTRILEGKFVVIQGVTL